MTKREFDQATKRFIGRPGYPERGVDYTARMAYRASRMRNRATMGVDFIAVRAWDAVTPGRAALHRGSYYREMAEQRRSFGMPLLFSVAS